MFSHVVYGCLVKEGLGCCCFLVVFRCSVSPFANLIGTSGRTTPREPDHNFASTNDQQPGFVFALCLAAEPNSQNRKEEGST